ncbi:hypothetical protein [Cupriavidus taiwanensis]|uniref:hypothetical protein n=1 Tax=Cupriavidus taiwanensis TaxID=164546 RepID=UPI000E10270A|nr:hypothetical protein [Cupriavidus taiwanensis]SOY56836.1 conserved hypothetical protein [Cupriavidus taiwanensis]SOY90755.1 conserved hypothetical protein [Cupriavidus taiwanensis]SOZ63543.1 conserved hypothetical protein [Cupriavidus taiwanensis]SOZ82573.1 conserved hypothetical protein [Cupriavidus taiwanensis]SOZ84428.1 conserved hypothetical protein [Cupriavidus taiwanensis]
MNLAQWLDATGINAPSITPGERERRRRERAAVLKRAGTSISTIRNAVSRGTVGIKLTTRMEKATKGTSAEVKVIDQMPELQKQPAG